MRTSTRAPLWVDLSDPATLTTLLDTLGRLSTLQPTDRPALVRAYLSFCLDSFGMRTAHVGELSDSEERLDGVLSLPGGCVIDERELIPLEATFCQYVRATGQPVLIRDAARDPRVARLASRRSARIGSYLGVPVLRGDGTLYGTLCVLDPAPRPLTSTHTAVMRIVAERLGPLLAPTAPTPQPPPLSPGRSLQTVAQAVAHDARSPLMVMQGNAELLALDPLTDEQAVCVASIRSAGALLTRLLNDLQEVAHGRQHFTLLAGQVDPVALGRQLAAAYREQAAKRALALTVSVEGQPPSIVADGQRVQQVLINLVSNALLYTLQGGVRLVVAAGEGGGVEFRVEDTGSGIPAELQGKIWERRVRGTLSQAGSGLGLALVREFVAAMGGSCGCQSVVGQGSTFWVRLPRHGPPPQKVEWVE